MFIEFKIKILKVDLSCAIKKSLGTHTIFNMNIMRINHILIKKQYNKIRLV